MTVIVTIISKSACVHASDSFLTIEKLTGSVDVIEKHKTKIIPVPFFYGALSYCGMASGQIVNSYGRLVNFETYEWLKQKSANARNFSTPEEFGNYLKDQLNSTISVQNFGANKYKTGIVIHFSAYEKIEGVFIPELFAIRNCNGINYQDISQNGFSIYRSTYESIPEEKKLPDKDINQNNYECRKLVKEYLQNGGIFFFNNGDPWLSSPSINAILRMSKVANDRNILINSTEIDLLKEIAIWVIKSVIKFQEKFLLAGRQVVGGYIHTKVIKSR